jgi:hypothetical protein
MSYLAEMVMIDNKMTIKKKTTIKSMMQLETQQKRWNRDSGWVGGIALCIVFFLK